MILRRSLVVSLIGLLCAVTVTEAGRAPNVPSTITDLKLSQYLTGLNVEFRDSLNRITTVFCGQSVLSTAMICEDFRGRIPDACTVRQVDAVVTVAPTGSTLIVDVNECTAPTTCTSIWDADQTQRLTFAVSSLTASVIDINDSNAARFIEAGNYLAIDVDQVGSLIAGGALTVGIQCRLGQLG